MHGQLPDIVVVGEPIDPANLRELVDRFFGDMVKLVIDVRRRLVADDCLQFTALINIRPTQDNRAMEVQDPQIRETMRDIVHELVGSGGPL